MTAADAKTKSSNSSAQTNTSNSLKHVEKEEPHQIEASHACEEAHVNLAFVESNGDLADASECNGHVPTSSSTSQLI